MRDDPALRQPVQAAANADTAAQLAATLSDESVDERRRVPEQKVVGRVTMAKQDRPGETNGTDSDRRS
jgi:hypothetical protein